jgi:hypothetical protein
VVDTERMAVWKPSNAQVIDEVASVARLNALGEGMKFHCFMSHKQVGGSHAMGHLQSLLRIRGWICWLDQLQISVDDEGMLRGIEESTCFLLYMTKHVFDSKYVCFEVSHAFKMHKPFILVHEADDRLEGFESMGNLVISARAAEAAGRLPRGFADLVLNVNVNVQSVVEFDTKDYLLKGVLEEIGDRISQAVSSSTSERRPYSYSL